MGVEVEGWNQGDWGQGSWGRRSCGWGVGLVELGSTRLELGVLGSVKLGSGG